MELKTVAKAFEKANKALNLNVVSLLKAAQSKPVTYTEEHIKIAEEAFRTAASLVDKYEEVASQNAKLIKKATKITALNDTIVAKDLVNKYEKIWKKVQQEYNKQSNQLGEQLSLDGFPEPLKAKLAELQQVIEEIRKENV
jgi:hypothetical protein